MTEKHLFQLQFMYREALALHGIIRDFGIKPDDVSLTLTNEMLLMVVAKQNGKEVGVRLGIIRDVKRKDFEAGWAEAVAVYRASHVSLRCRLQNTSKINENKANIIAGLVAEGFRPWYVE